ncbi:MAG: hypothetical protein LKM45_05465 [Wolbachia endosymbiont of Alcedoecus sp.]|nr:hypothetical protein [Wolbachia endosymbiont of Alcedoecus sp.]
MPKHTFSIACSEDIVGGESKYKRIKLVGNLDGEEKTITFCGPCIGAYSIRKRNEEESFQLWTESA